MKFRIEKKMKRKIFIAAMAVIILVLTGCTVTEADKHAVGMEVVKQTIRSAFSFGTSAAVRAIR